MLLVWGVVIELSGAVIEIIRLHWGSCESPWVGEVGGERSQWTENAVLLRAFASVFVSSLLPETMASPGKDNYRMKSYKNNALNPEEMRRKKRGKRKHSALEAEKQGNSALTWAFANVLFRRWFSHRGWPPPYTLTFPLGSSLLWATHPVSFVVKKCLRKSCPLFLFHNFVHLGSF